MVGWKKDMERAFRQLILCPSAWSYLAVYFCSALFFDRAVVMGSRSAPYVCQRSTSVIRHVMTNMSYHVYNYCDDFMSVNTPSRAWAGYAALGNLLRDLGVREAEDKSVPPTTVIEFLGVIFDLIRMLLIIPEDKLDDIRSTLSKVLETKRVTKKQMQSLIGKLQFASLCVRPGCVFISRLYDSISSMPEEGTIEVDQEAMLDLKWWNKYLQVYNGVSIMWMYEDQQIIAFSMDACMTGIGGCCRFRYFHDAIPQNLLETLTVNSKVNITYLEMVALVIGLKL